MESACRMDLGLADASHAESNLSSKTLNAARSILWALQQEDLRAKLADAENELKCACQSLRYSSAHRLAIKNLSLLSHSSEAY